MKLLIVDFSRLSASNYYRDVGPLGKIQEVTISMRNQHVDDRDLMSSHIVLIPRPYTEAHANIIYKCKSYGIPVWIDYDDDLTNVPYHNPSYKAFRNQEKHIVTALKNADVVTVSTKHLAGYYKEKYDVECKVLVNATHPKYLPETARVYDTIPNFVYRGRNSHHRDLLTAEKQLKSLEQVANEGHANLIFFGLVPYFLNAYTMVDVVPMADYFHILKKHCRPSVMFFPLEDNHFNKCKSNIVWQEATRSGSILWTNFSKSEFSRNGIWSGITSLSYLATHESLQEICNDSFKISREEILEHYNLEVENRKRREIILQLNS